ncbi:homeobox protein CHOX-CAD [Cephus cinctus]|uniref:Homeobox protein CHOX-CAD n=1 Tax=Cephus cinctus TaxID=211228 RepID=A0AAJ7FL13_CEPCN|nr:homeobox protein CHOX-CAD [Cephus cinctus]
MTDISSIGMVSYYNPLTMYRGQQTGSQQALGPVQQGAPGQASGQGQQGVVSDSTGQQYWYTYGSHGSYGAHHQNPGAQQYLDHPDVLWPPHPHPAHHYSHHLQYQHHHHHHHQAYPHQQIQPEWTSGDETSGNAGNNGNPVGTGEPSPPITVSGSEISSPGTPATPPANGSGPNGTNTAATTTPVRPAQIRSPYEWMKKPSYQSQPNPGKTRTKDKYRVVYTDQQRLELEKEFHYSRYITIRRKAELAATLALSERQVKIWFQNRRAKERKQVKKREELEQKDSKPSTDALNGAASGGMASLAALGGMGGMLGGLMHNGGSPPLGLGPPHSLAALGHSPASLHSHSHQHSHPAHTLAGL